MESPCKLVIQYYYEVTTTPSTAADFQILVHRRWTQFLKSKSSSTDAVSQILMHRETTYVIDRMNTRKNTVSPTAAMALGVRRQPCALSFRYLHPWFNSLPQTTF